MVASVTRSQVLSFRVRAQQLNLDAVALADSAVLDIGVQDTGPDGARWAMANRGVEASELSGDKLVKVWTIRGAPHLYQREHLPSVAAAVAPFSDADAGKRIYDASKPLKAAGISNLAALDAVAGAMRSVVTKPTVKGDVSRLLSAVMDPAYLRFCRPCNATHLYEMPFRLAALRAGLELEPDTSPPVLRPVPGFEPDAVALRRHEVIRAYLRLLGPANAKLVAGYLDAPVKDVKNNWPEDAVEVSVDGEARWLMPADEEKLTRDKAPSTRLLGPFDLFLQARDRQLLVSDPARAKALWPVLGRPGAVLLDGDIAGLWRPRKSGRRFQVTVDLWVATSPSVRAAITEQAERLALFRQTSLTGVEFDS